MSINCDSVCGFYGGHGGCDERLLGKWAHRTRTIRLAEWASAHARHVIYSVTRHDVDEYRAPLANGGLSGFGKYACTCCYVPSPEAAVRCRAVAVWPRECGVLCDYSHIYVNGVRFGGESCCAPEVVVFWKCMGHFPRNVQTATKTARLMNAIRCTTGGS